MLVPRVRAGCIMAIIVHGAGVEVQVGDQICEVDNALTSSVL